MGKRSQIRSCLGYKSQPSGITAIFLVTLTGFATDSSAKRDGFCDGFCGGFFACVFPKEKDGFWDGFWDHVSLAKNGQKGKIIWG